MAIPQLTEHTDKLVQVGVFMHGNSGVAKSYDLVDFVLIENGRQ